ncbi:MAG: methyltransferase domain-containing protein [Thermicanus sp.]|nr:methyltransferase domain-containing protein [Thermicanus sp.]
MIKIKKLNHVQICIPVGEEEKARQFYGEILGFKEIPKPTPLLAHGGMWYQVGEIELHIGVENGEGGRSKRHPAFEVENLPEVRRYLETHGIQIQDEQPIPSVNRFSFFDPFGNRIEFLEKEKEPLPFDAEKRRVQQQFSQSAEEYVQSRIHAKGEDLKKLVELSGVQGKEYLLDVATGGGHVANTFAPLVEKVIALDLTQKMLETAERFITGNGHRNVDYVLGDAENLPFQRSFDLVICRLAAHHFPRVERFIGEVKRVLKPDGLFLLVDNVAPEEEELDQVYNRIEKIRDNSHIRAMKKSEWVRMLENGGLSLVELYSFKKVFYFDDWCDRMKLSQEEKEGLSRYMLQLPEKIKRYFAMTMEEDHLHSFQVETIIAKAKKGMTDRWE